MLPAELDDPPLIEQVSELDVIASSGLTARDIANAAELLRPAHADPVQQALQEMADRIDASHVHLQQVRDMIDAREVDFMVRWSALRDNLVTLENRIRSVEIDKLVRAHNHGR
jgi:phytoene/squalene synthetase